MGYLFYDKDLYEMRARNFEKRLTNAGIFATVCEKRFLKCGWFGV